MARTRGASAGFIDDGQVFGKGGVAIQPTKLDRQGNPISPAAANLPNQRNLAGSTVLRGPGAEPVPVLNAITHYRADKKSWSRNIDGYDLARLLDMMLRNPGSLGDGLVVEVTVDEFANLDGNLRQHFMAVRG